MKTVITYVREGWWGGLVGLLLSLPVGLHVHFFGWKISDNLETWARTGDAMAGIYGPILSILAFIILFHQYKLQQHNNKHMYDHSYLTNARADVDFYLIRLSALIDVLVLEGASPRSVLCHWFRDASEAELRGAEAGRTSALIEKDAPQLFAMWTTFYSILGGLGSVKESDFELQHSSAMQKAIAMLSYPTCVDLDKFHYCMTGGHNSVNYMFSSELSQRNRS